MKRLAIWTVLVYLSAIAGFWAAIVSEYSSVEDIAGMILGVTTFVFVYYLIDKNMEKKGHGDWQKSLKHSVFIKMVLQLFPAIELGAGFLANATLQLLGYKLPVLLFSYVMTLLVGFQLSLVVAIIFAFVRYIVYLKRKHSYAA